MSAAAAYVRVSTHQQDWKLQRDAIARACKARGDRIPKRLWFEEKRSGASIDRPALQKLRAAVRAGRVGRLYVFRIDRLTRSGIRDTLGLVQEFRGAGCELVTVSDGFDLNGPGAEIVLAVLAWAAQFERNAIGERIKAARRRIEAKGGRWGRPGSVDVRTLARAIELQQEPRTVREIAVALKVKRSTLSDALSGRGRYSDLLELAQLQLAQEDLGEKAGSQGRKSSARDRAANRSTRALHTRGKARKTPGDAAAKNRTAASTSHRGARAKAR